MTVTRGTSNGNARGSAENRRARRAWLMGTWASDVEGFVRCYRCGDLLYNEDDPNVRVAFDDPVRWVVRLSVGPVKAKALTIDRIIPGCQGGTYRRNNIRPACGACNSETGGSQRSTKRKMKA